MMGGRGTGSPATRVSVPTTAPPPTPQAPEVTTDRVRAAYRAIRRGQDHGLVSLADLRDRVGGDRAAQDAAITELVNAREATLVPQSNQKVLTQRQRDAAIRRGNEDRHLIVFD